MPAPFGRLITAMVTPFTGEGAVDYDRARQLAQALVASGSEGLVMAGSTGEGATLSAGEKLRLFGEIKEAVGDRAQVIAYPGTASTGESVELTTEAEKRGVDGMLLVVPYYNKPTQEGLYQHFRSIALHTRLPCILYNVPSRTGTNLAAETVIRLSQMENIIGVKEASGNLEQIGRIIQGTSSDFYVWSGNDSDTLPILAIGGYGVISVASHLVGLQIQEMIRHFLEGRTQEAARIHRHLLPLVDALFILSNPIPVRYALGCAGLPVGAPRLPLTEPDAKSAATIQETLKAYRIDLPVAALQR